MGAMRVLATAALLLAWALASGAMAFSSGRPDMADPNGPGPDGFPMIFTFVEARDTEGITALLKQGADINARGFFDQTPVLKAAMANSWRVVDQLLKAGADPRLVDRRGFNLPYLANTSQIVETTENGRVLREVILPALKAQGLMDPAYHPSDVKARVAAGTWPPAEWP